MIMKKKLIMLLAFLMVIIMLCNISSANSANIAPALYIFGDSLVDNGNNNMLPTIIKSNFDPYGMNFAEGPTGRFTNGKTLADFAADLLGLPSPPPYASFFRLVLNSPNELTGINFASGGAGILAETGIYYGKLLTFQEQINLFSIIARDKLPKQLKTAEERTNYLAKSIFGISIGNNDYLNNYVDTISYDTSKRYTPQAFTKLLINELSLQLQKLYHLGARKVIIPEIGPIGCIPFILRRFKHEGVCNDPINQLAIIFNEQLASMLQNLTSTLQGSAFSLAHVYNLIYDAVVNPSHYGLTDSSNPCCDALLNGTLVCVPGLGFLRACENPDKYLFWDGFHPTESAYKLMASKCWTDSSFCTPRNLKDLVLQV